MRSYDDPCGVARALDVIGERWALLVVRELLFGAKRFSDLARGLTGISQNVLSQRLRELEQSGIVRVRRLGPPASVKVYELTQRGADLEPVLIELGRWGSREVLGSASEMSVDALILALKTTFDPDRAAGLAGRFDLQFNNDAFEIEIEEGYFHARRGTADTPDAVLEADVVTLRGVVFGGRPFSDLRIHGDRESARRFSRCFPRPVSADA
ncbi:winged helix-turn-helix transcriptional regulator [Amycolatopsis sp.]|uniref:winged helix-turn-helix transcriptional regulator n=1 Tax=Amycolatopsis sp. TaxID=37632 RepID=UPI002C3408D1|nr:winged helix-turn-helix transcriptional regulator [Amycolatopsis sp.]HVV09919.1 winged helix-turn-helix transcriptional regulator [Amycolatopsis sp.]